ncbi:MAG TPA: dihydropyrimidinase [Lachnospiraceae bacterium]|nr:dihydropyrimidinase [Lachnospiraceae bacterium]
MEKLIIKNGTVVSDTECVKADVLINGEQIEAVTAGISEKETLERESVQVIDATGMLVFPGAVDAHTHMDLDVGYDRSCDTFYSGTVAAACGGTTTIIDHMAFGPEGSYPRHQAEEYHRLADGEAVIDYSFHGVLWDRADKRTLSEMRELSEDEGITSFKLYLTYDRMLHDRDAFAVLASAKKDNILIAVHCENDGIVSFYRELFPREGKLSARYHALSRPPEAEAEAVNRMLYMARCAGEAPLYIVHLSSEAGLREILNARSRGQKHFAAETCPQYLLLDEALYEDPVNGLKAVMSPPVRKKADREALWQALSEHTIDTVATDHCPFTFGRQKRRGLEDFRRCPNGAPGVEERFLLMYSEGIRRGLSLCELTEYLCTAPARIFGLYPKKGIIRPGSDADILIFDPGKSTVLTRDKLHGNADYTCYEGLKVSGFIDTVLRRGRVIVKNGEFLGKKGEGRFLKRGISSLC